MANEGKLEGLTIAATYKSLLKVANDSDGGGVAANANVLAADTLKAVEDGYGNISSLALATNRATITLGTTTGDDFAVSDGSSNILLVEGDTKDVTLLDDLILISDASAIKMGAGADFTITHDNDIGATLAGSPITITSAEAATWSTSSGALTLTSAAAATWSTSAGALTISGLAGVNIQENGATIIGIDTNRNIGTANTAQIDIDCSGNMSLNSSAGVLNIGDDAVAQAINIGTGAAARVITMGNVTGASSLHLKAGTGDVQITGNVGIGTASSAYNLHLANENASAHNTFFISNNIANYDSIIQLQAKNNSDTAHWAKLFLDGSTESLVIDMNDTTGAFTILQDGKVGIGTIAPPNLLSASPVQYSAGTAYQAGTTVTGSSTSWTTSMIGSQFVFADGTSAGAITAHSSGTSMTVTNSQTVGASDDLKGYKIHYQGLQVTSVGNVGIGTASPDSPLSLETASAMAVNIDNWSNSQTTPATIYLRKNKGTDFSTDASVADDTQLGAIYFQGMNVTGTNDYETGAYILARVDGSAATQDNDMPTELVFATSPENSQSGAANLVISSSGNVGIGTEDPTALLTVGAINTLVTDGVTAVTPEGMNVHITEASKYAMGIKNADASGDGLLVQAGDASDDFALHVQDYDRAGELLVVRGDGNVGIGTASPNVRLTVGSHNTASTTGVNGAMMVSGTYFYSTGAFTAEFNTITITYTETATYWGHWFKIQVGGRVDAFNNGYYESIVSVADSDGTQVDDENELVQQGITGSYAIATDAGANLHTITWTLSDQLKDGGGGSCLITTSAILTSFTLSNV